MSASSMPRNADFNGESLLFHSISEIVDVFGTGILGVALLCFGIRITKLVHAIGGTLITLMLASLFMGFGAIQLRWSVIGVCTLLGSALGIFLIPQYPEALGGATGLVLGEVLMQFATFSWGTPHYMTWSLLGLMIGSMASTYLFKDDAVQTLFSCMLGAFFLLDSVHSSAQLLLPPRREEDLWNMMDGFCFLPRNCIDPVGQHCKVLHCSVWYVAWMTCVWVYAICQGIQAQQILLKERREKEDQKKWEASLWNFSDKKPRNNRHDDM